LDELSEGAGFSGRCPSGREHGPEIDPGQFRIAMTQKLRRIIDEGVTLGLALEGIGAADVARAK
jgi:hypothetical protein